MSKLSPPDKPCHDSIHCVNWNFCRKCAPDYSLAVLDAYTRKGRRTSGAYEEAIAEVNGQIAEAHHEADEADEKFQTAVHELAAHSNPPEG
jgi:hypothetical protein